MTDYQIEDTFVADPKYAGWSIFQGASLDWNNVDAIGGEVGSDADARYSKFIGKPLTQSDNITSLMTVLIKSAMLGSPSVLFGFFNANRAHGQEECLGIKINAGTGLPKVHLYIAYSDGTKIDESTIFAMSQNVKYIFGLRHSPEDGKAYLEIYDYLTEQLLFEYSTDLDETKTFYVNQIGISEMNASFVETMEIWSYSVKAVGEPEPIVYSELYCTPGEARDMTNLDRVQDMDDYTLSRIEVIYAIPQVNARFRSEGYSVPFDTGDETPPLIRTITALLTAAFAAKKAYIGHAPSESPNWDALLNEVNSIFKRFLQGQMELVTVGGDWIERTLPTSTDMLSTTEDRTTLFSLDDVPDITAVISGGAYIGRSIS